VQNPFAPRKYTVPKPQISRNGTMMYGLFGNVSQNPVRTISFRTFHAGGCVPSGTPKKLNVPRSEVTAALSVPHCFAIIASSGTSPQRYAIGQMNMYSAISSGTSISRRERNGLGRMPHFFIIQPHRS
jgi:hypothetical protein